MSTNRKYFNVADFNRRKSTSYDKIPDISIILLCIQVYYVGLDGLHMT